MASSPKSSSDSGIMNDDSFSGIQTDSSSDLKAEDDIMIKEEIDDAIEKFHNSKTLPKPYVSGTAKVIIKGQGKIVPPKSQHKCPTCRVQFNLLADYLTHLREHNKSNKFISSSQKVLIARGYSIFGKAPNILKKPVSSEEKYRNLKDYILAPANTKEIIRHLEPSEKKAKQAGKYATAGRVPQLSNSLFNNRNSSSDKKSNLSLEDLLDDFDETEQFGAALKIDEDSTDNSRTDESTFDEVIEKVISSGCPEKAQNEAEKASKAKKNIRSRNSIYRKYAGWRTKRSRKAMESGFTVPDLRKSAQAKFQEAEEADDLDAHEKLKISMDCQQYNPDIYADGSRNAYVCSICGERFVTIRAVNHHEKTLHPEVSEQPLKCNLCNQVLKNRRGLRSHEIRLHSMPAARELKVSLDPTIAIYRCSMCDPVRAFDTEEQLEYHSEMFHPTGEKRVWVRQYGCEECGDIFNDIKTLFNHRKQAHDFIPEVDERQKYPCRDCGESYDRPFKLAVHRKKAHDDGSYTEPYHCHLCHKGFKTKCGINSHVESAHSDKGPMPFQCQHCGRRYATKHNWRKHIKSHLIGVEYLICSGCGKRYLHTNSLQFHQRSCDGYKAVTRLETTLDDNCEQHKVVEVDGLQQYECKVCSYVAKSRSGFVKHYKNAHFAMEALSSKEQEQLVSIYAEAEFDEEN